MLYLQSLNTSIHKLMENYSDVYVIGEDITDPYGGAFKVTKGLSSKYPDRVLSTPISEAAIVGIGIGLSMKDFKPIVEIMFGDFITLATDQIVNGATKFSWMYGGNFNVPLVIRTPMGGNRGYGATHSQSLEKLYFGVPGLVMVAPSIFHNPGELLENCVRDVFEPLIFVENKILYPMELKKPSKRNYIDNFLYEMINDSNSLFPTVILKTDEAEVFDVSIITYGGMAQKAINAAKEKFMEDETSIKIIIPSIIKPIPEVDILHSAESSKNIIIIEENNKYGGWATELSCLIYENYHEKLNYPIIRIGAEETPIPSYIKQEKLTLPQESTIIKALNKLH